MDERVIMHIDMNSYFATVEQQANPFLRGKPVIVGGSPDSRTVVAAASVEAKKFGVKSGMSLYEAKKLCPHLLLVEGDHEKYADITLKFLAIFETYSPVLEIFSIDEAFLDVTHTQERFGGAKEIALKIKKRLREEVGEWLSCSIGIAPNKLMAKLASSLEKPDGLVVVKSEDIPLILKKTKLTDLCGIGGKTASSLLSIGIDSMEKLAGFPEKVLVKRFGINGKILKKMALGEDDSPVVPYYEEPPYKSMAHHYTLPEDCYEMEEVKDVLLRLSEKVGRRLRTHNYRGRTITLILRTSDFFTFQRQDTLDRYIDDGYEIFSEACKIMRKLTWRGGVRMVGVSVSSLAKDCHQLSLLSDEESKRKLIEALDRINNKYGEFTVQRARNLETRLRKHTGGYVEKSKLIQK